MNRRRLAAFIFLVAGILAGFWLAGKISHSPSQDTATARKSSPVNADVAPLREPAPKEPTTPSKQPFPFGDALVSMLTEEGARPNEAVLTFKTPAGYSAFLARAGALGLKVLDSIDQFRSVRVGYDSLAGLTRDLRENATDYAEIGANLYLQPPENEQPPVEERDLLAMVPVGDHLLAALGIENPGTQWGKGVTIAVLDSGVAADATFGSGRLRSLDIGLGVSPLAGDGHGTAVASLAAGAGANASGVAPSANILSIKVTGADGVSDSFTVARAIVAAVDAGAQIVNLSLGGYGSSGIVSEAVAYAASRNVAIVASAGNDQAATVTYPAAERGVVAVGAVDAVGQQALFSNSGPELAIAAPGYAINTAWLDGGRVQMSGTSASAAIVSGGIAAVMSVNPGMTATAASQVIQKYASEAGPVGTDSSYGSGIMNLGWAMSPNDPARVDLAVASQLYNKSSSELEVVIQNRSGLAITNAQLNLNIGTVSSTQPVPYLAPGAVYSIQAPVSTGPDGVQVKSTLLAPAGLTDQYPANNVRSGFITKPAN